MNQFRGTARLVGALFIIGTVVGLIGLGAFQEPVVGADDYLVQASSHADQLVTGALLELVMGVALMAITIVLYPVLRVHEERLALAYVVARTVEVITYVVDVVLVLTILSVSRKFVGAGPADGSSLAALGDTLVAARDWLGHGVNDAMAFGPSAVVLNVALYRARLVPPWLSVWGLGGAVLYIVAGVLVLYGLEPLSSTQVALEAPLGVQEMVLALWLIIRGFTMSETPSMVAARPSPA